jgi:hypothetical protein
VPLVQAPFLPAATDASRDPDAERDQRQDQPDQGDRHGDNADTAIPEHATTFASDQSETPPPLISSTTSG